MRCVAKALPSSRLAPALLIVTVALSLGACSNSRYANHQPPTWAGAVSTPVPSSAVANSRYEPEAGDPIKDAPVEPLRRRQVEPDDPSEPFSPNYGGPANLTATRRADVEPTPVPTAASTIIVPDASRAYFRRRIVTAGAD